MIGIIIPPGEIKKLVEKTAEHVAINGSEFEQMILQRQQHKIEFAFLNKQNPYRSYYDHMVAEISKKLIQQQKDQQQQSQNDPNSKPKDVHMTHEEQELKVQELEQMMGTTDIQNDQKDFIEKVFEEIKEPDPDRFVAEFPEKITEAEIAIIQHTAQYVAKNGKNFLSALSEREKNNPQFQFLKSSSSNHEYFKKMYEAYQTILNLSQADISRLTQISQKKEAIFSKCEQIFKYHEAMKGAKDAKKNDKADKDKEQDANIDWNDYELVETIVFEDMTGMQSKNKRMMNGAERMSQAQKSALPNPFAHRTMEEKVISNPKKREILQQCHVCKQNILASEMTKHLKTCLGDKKRQQPTVPLSSGDGEEVDIRKNIEQLSKKRADIFGGDGAKITRENNQDEKVQNEEKVIWDGQGSNITRATGSVAMVNNQQKKIRQQQQANNKK